VIPRSPENEGVVTKHWKLILAIAAFVALFGPMLPLLFK
jgi:hypothetical protein